MAKIKGSLRKSMKNGTRSKKETLAINILCTILNY